MVPDAVRRRKPHRGALITGRWGGS